MSFRSGSGSGYEAIAVHVRRLARSGMLCVCSAGNHSLNLDMATFLPAELEETLCVGSVDRVDCLASHSNYGRKVDILAPGVKVRTASVTGGYCLETGTSFACGFVSGIVACELSRENFLTADAIKTRVRNLSRRKGWTLHPLGMRGTTRKIASLGRTNT
ncbi:subtilisin-like protein [Ascobolus immersus RN42]|uniref:Subtilisin-like protein n=1 Tax=Ascobolus immersus RN42 TaxID=1160509 RepID=A0A3N4IKF9_ASCIM|nr:subtilisin-like protein [Ascobolus immersus RN42]